MNPNILTEEIMALLHSKLGLYTLLKSKKVNLEKIIEEINYLQALKAHQQEIINIQNWVIEHDKKVVILFEGRDAAGKGGAIRRFTEYLNPRHFRVVALNIPTNDEKKQWFFQRYINQLPKPGEMVFFDRSWYNRAVVEPVNGFCTDKQYKIFMSHVNDFERMLVQSDTHLIKFYFSITKEEQAKRFDDIKSSPLKRWKMTSVDERAQRLWDEYTSYKIAMFAQTNTKIAPWQIIDADKKASARLMAITHIIKALPCS